MYAKNAASKIRMATILIPLLFLVCAGVTVAQLNQVPKTLVSFSEEELSKLGRNSEVVNAVTARNDLGTSLEEIQRTDEEWRNTEGVTRFMLDLMSNDLALLLHNYEHTYGFIVETFVMDNKGANVAQTARTSDYWQGDEAKFSQSFNNGQGSIHYGDVEYDGSADEIVVQVSVPVLDGSRAIGAITFGVSLDRWERR